MGLVWPSLSSFVSHSSLPVRESNARKRASIGAGDENQSARRRDAAALAERAGVVHAFGFQFIARAERDCPGDVAGVRVNRQQVRPGRLLAGHLIVRIPEARIERAAAGSGLKRR